MRFYFVHYHPTPSSRRCRRNWYVIARLGGPFALTKARCATEWSARRKAAELQAEMDAFRLDRWSFNNPNPPDDHIL